MTCCCRHKDVRRWRWPEFLKAGERKREREERKLIKCFISSDTEPFWRTASPLPACKLFSFRLFPRVSSLFAPRILICATLCCLCIRYPVLSPGQVMTRTNVYLKNRGQTFFLFLSALWSSTHHSSVTHKCCPVIFQQTCWSVSVPILLFHFYYFITFKHFRSSHFKVRQKQLSKCKMFQWWLNCCTLKAPNIEIFFSIFYKSNLEIFCCFFVRFCEHVVLIQHKYSPFCILSKSLTKITYALYSCIHVSQIKALNLLNVYKKCKYIDFKYIDPRSLVLLLQNY